jgi:YggT family protein
MVVVSGLLSAVALVVVLFEICLLGRAVFSWIEPIPRNRVNRFFIQVTEPVVRPVRRVIPPLGGLDLSVLVVFIGLGIILRILTSYGAVVPFPF